MRIFKQHLELGMNKLRLPIGTQIISFRLQRDKPTIWFVQTDEQTHTDRIIEVLFTGAQVDFSMYKFLGTDESSDGLVYHAMEILP